jgi:hypothetical protein
MAILYNSNYNDTLPFSDTCVQLHLSANTELTYVVPGTVTTQYQALFEYNQSSNVFVRLNGAPTIPSSGTSGTQQYNEYKPKKRYVKGGDVIHLISPDAVTYMGFSLRQLN